MRVAASLVDAGSAVYVDVAEALPRNADWSARCVAVAALELTLGTHGVVAVLLVREVCAVVEAVAHVLARQTPARAVILVPHGSAAAEKLRARTLVRATVALVRPVSAVHDAVAPLVLAHAVRAVGAVHAAATPASGQVRVAGGVAGELVRVIRALRHAVADVSWRDAEAA